MSGSMQKALLSSTPVDDNDVKEFTSAKPLRKASKSDIEDLLGVKVDSALFTNVNDNGKSSSRRQSFDDGGMMFDMDIVTDGTNNNQGTKEFTPL